MCLLFSLNYLAVVVAAVVNMIVGSLWFGPLFGKQWTALAGVKMENPPDPSEMTRYYFILFLCSLVMAFVFDHFIIYESYFLKIDGIAAGLQAGLCAWVGFIVPVTLATFISERKPAAYWSLINLYWLVVMLLNGMLLAIWK